MSHLLHNIHLKNLLSFGPDGADLELRPLNVLIGPNASGKSNLIEAISLLQAAPRNLFEPMRSGMEHWLWKRGWENTGDASLSATVETKPDGLILRHTFSFIESGLINERIADQSPNSGRREPHCYYWFDGKSAELTAEGMPRTIATASLNLRQSILSQRKDPDQFSEITALGNLYEQIRIYREWFFGRSAPLRGFQYAADRGASLEENCSNLSVVLERSRSQDRLLKSLKQLYPGVRGIGGTREAGNVQLIVDEDGTVLPATRLSDGTLRYLCMLVILLQENPPPLVCIEEPELGLHPDAVIELGGLMKEASARMQLIVTTHSEALVDCLSDSPEDVVVCERNDGGTQFHRLDHSALAEWLQKYSLGQLWRRGEIGGNRW